MQNTKHDVVKKYEDVKYDDDEPTEKKALVEQGVTDINNLVPLPESNELPLLNPATNPVEEIDIPMSI